jgi:hypothetical protein
MRGRPPVTEDNIRPNKFEMRYENNDSTEVWKYDLNKNPTGPIEVIIEYKKDVVKNWGNKLKEAKAQKKVAKQMKQIQSKSKKNVRNK